MMPASPVIPAVTLQPSRSWPWVLALIYTLSGVAALGYEVLWVRMLSLQFGVSNFGVVVTVAAFMAGLGGGSLLGAQWAPRLRSPLRALALVELGVACYALVLPAVMAALDGALSGVASQLGFTGWYAVQFGASLVLLGLPAVALGAGFPMVLRAAAGTPLTLGWIYGLNTCGAALGALLPLALLPALGWGRALQCTATLGIAVGVVAWLLPGRAWVERETPARALRPRLGHLLAYAGVGAAALMLQVGWTRLYGMLLLRTEYVLAVILAVFLTGVGVGSLLARQRGGPNWLNWMPLVAAGWAVLSLAATPWVAAWAEHAQFTSLAGALWAQGLVIALAILPATLALGAWLPLLTRVAGEGGASGPWFYGANALGSAAGAVAAGFGLIPVLGTPGTLVVAAALLFLCGMFWAPRRWPWLGALVLMPLAVYAWQLPPVAVLLPVSQGDGRDVYRHEDAISITHVVERADGQRLLLADLQRMDASTEPLAVVSQQNQARLPLLLHPAPHRVLFLGLGTGISAAGSMSYGPLDRTAVEISAGAIAAARAWFVPVNAGVMRDMHVVRDDARRFLYAADGRYDVIVGDLFHPDLAGRSSLLSVQQFARARARLAPQGVFVQWLALNQFDAASLEVVLRSFAQVFPRAMVFADGFRLALAGPRDGYAGADATLHHLAVLTPEATGGEGGWTWLGRYWGPVVVGPGPVQDEWAPRIEFSLPRARYQGALDVVGPVIWLLAHRPGVSEAAAQLRVSEAGREDFERAYIATDLFMRSWVSEFKGDGDEALRLMRLAYQANPRDRWVGLALADRMYAMLPALARAGQPERVVLEAILKLRPDHTEALRAMWRLEARAGRQPEALAYRTRLGRISPLDRELRAGEKPPLP